MFNVVTRSLEDNVVQEIGLFYHIELEPALDFIRDEAEHMERMFNSSGELTERPLSYTVSKDSGSHGVLVASERFIPSAHRLTAYHVVVTEFRQYRMDGAMRIEHVVEPHQFDTIGEALEFAEGKLADRVYEPKIKCGKEYTVKGKDAVTIFFPHRKD